MSDLLPPNATDAERALSIAVRPEIPVPLRTLWNPYACPANVLPWLAWALSVDEWDATWPETTQRQTIAASISQHKIKGTVGAVKSALLRGLGRTVEINENTGVPYTFGIRVQLLEGESSGGAIGGELMERARGIVAKTKNARSELVNESYFTEAGTAAIYTGAAMLNGAEVEIKGAPTPLPLDGYTAQMIGSFWTVRMHSDYTGPIAKVRRYSDGADLDYYDLRELKAFIEGESYWYFLKFYCQSGPAAPARAVNYGAYLGEIDPNGIPRAMFLDFTTTRFSAPIQNVYLPESSIITAGIANLPGGFQTTEAEISESISGIGTQGPLVSQGAAYGGVITSRWRSGIVELLDSSSPNCIGSLFQPGSATAVSESLSNNDALANTSPVIAKAVSFGGSDGWDNTPLAGTYGAAFWKKNITVEVMQAAITAVKIKLEF